MTNPLKKAPIRALVLLFAGAIAAVCAYILTSEIIEYENNEEGMSGSYIYSSKYHQELNELYSDLWIVGNMYMANISGGEYTVNEYMQKGIEGYLRSHGLMNESGDITIGEYDKLEYIVKCGTMTYSNTDKTLEELETSQFGVWQHDSDINYDHSFADMHPSGYTTKYGKTVYYINGWAHNFYSFDTEGLSYYYYPDVYPEGDAEYARNYYRLDGTTPLPPPGSMIVTDAKTYYINEMDDLSDILAEIELYGIEKAEIFYTDDYTEYAEPKAVYDMESGRWIAAASSNFYDLPGNVYICIAPNDEMMQEYEAAIVGQDANDQQLIRRLVVAAICVFFALLIAVLYFVYCGYDTELKGFKLAMCDKWYTEILLGMLALLALGAYGYISEALDILPSRKLWDTFVAVAYCSGIGVMFIIALLILGCLINKLKCRSFLKTMLLYRLVAFCYRKTHKGVGRLVRSVRMIGLMSHNAYFKRHLIRYIISAFLTLVILCFLGSGAIDGDVFGWSVVAIVLLFIIYLMLDMRDAKAVAKLSERIEKIRGGDYSSEEPDIRNITYKMQEDLNSISEGVNTAVEERIRSERMKIDLVTNVSHDLKTPLTSIISYVDLLSKEDLPDEAADYVNILVDKTQRLKAIISDLFDLAKATSETDMQMEELDAVILVRQVLADMEDKIDRFGRDIRTDIKPESVKVIGEGKKLYRIVQNVIDNALKYSLDNTRIYLTLSQTDTHAVITVKNIASYEMDFTGDEIVERFARGDKSRTSEGNGLGLSIAKSFAQACGGSFTVTPEGDVFTAELRLAKTTK